MNSLGKGALLLLSLSTKWRLRLSIIVLRLQLRTEKSLIGKRITIWHACMYNMCCLSVKVNSHHNFFTCFKAVAGKANILPINIAPFIMLYAWSGPHSSHLNRQSVAWNNNRQNFTSTRSNYRSRREFERTSRCLHDKMQMYYLRVPSTADKGSKHADILAQQFFDWWVHTSVSVTAVWPRHSLCTVLFPDCQYNCFCYHRIVVLTRPLSGNSGHSEWNACLTDNIKEN